MRNRPPRFLSLPPKTIGQIMTLVAFSALGLTAVLPRPGNPLPGPPKFRAWPALRATQPISGAPVVAPAPGDHFLRVVPEGLDEAILVEAPAGTDEAMLVNPYAPRPGARR